jgi:hypothetical protein
MKLGLDDSFEPSTHEVLGMGSVRSQEPGSHAGLTALCDVVNCGEPQMGVKKSNEVLRGQEGLGSVWLCSSPDQEVDQWQEHCPAMDPC